MHNAFQDAGLCLEVKHCCGFLQILTQKSSSLQMLDALTLILAKRISYT